MAEWVAITQERAWAIYFYFQAGGPIMWPLLFVSIWLWTLIGVKLFEINAFRKRLNSLDLPGIWPEDAGQKQTGEHRLEALLIRQEASLDRHVGTIQILASLAPLIGLLGTVSGMIETFEVIYLHGSGYARGMAAGISEALLTTQGGLMVALPGLFMGNFISRRVERLKDGLARLGLARINELYGDTNVAQAIET